MHRAGIALLLLMSLCSLNVQADIKTASKYFPDASLVGEARLRYLWWDVYDAKLYAQQGQYAPNEPFALSLTYLRKLKGKKIAEKSISEMRKQQAESKQTLLKWQDILSNIFPDVEKNLVLTGVRDHNGHTVFYSNGTFIGRIDDPQFTIGFFNIWLGESTSRPALRNKLLGRASSS